MKRDIPIDPTLRQHREPKPKRCVCDFLTDVLSPGHTPRCPVHPNGRKLTRGERRV